jgi:hypothetical protein
MKEGVDGEKTCSEGYIYLSVSHFQEFKLEQLSISVIAMR